MAQKFAVSGQHYLFDVQAFAHTILALGGEEYSYALRDRTTRGVISDVVEGRSEVGVLMRNTRTAADIDREIEAAGLEFHELATSKPRVALPASHPLSNATSLTPDQLADWPYVYFEQEDGAPDYLAEEALGDLPHAKSIALTDRASLSELTVAMNGYTFTSGILVGITDGGSLTTIPLESDVELSLGYVARKNEELSPIAQRFVEKLARSLELYAK